MAKSSGGVRGGGNRTSGLVVSLRKEENSIRNNTYETGIVLDSKGNVLLRKKGGAGSVEFNKSEVALMKDAIFTHNHPSALTKQGVYRIGNAMSRADLVTAVSSNMQEMRAVTTAYTFIMRRPKKGWNATPSQVDRAVRQAEKKVREKMEVYIARYKGDERTAINRANVLRWNMVNREVAKKFGWIYKHHKG